MKKNGIILDLIGLGDLSDKQKEILQVMHETVKTENNCELVFIEAGSSISDVLFTSRILGAEPVAMPAMN
jgi:hypothetical protein